VKDVATLCARARELRHEGALRAAIAACREALTLAPNHPTILNELGLALSNDARYDEAIATFEQAAAYCNEAAPLINLGNALRSSARKAEAVVAYRAALRRGPDDAAALYNMHAALDDRDEAAAALERSVALRPDHVESRFHLAALRDEPCDAPEFMTSSYELVRRHPDAVRLSDTFDTLRVALERARDDGLVIELGVRRGTSLRFLATLAPKVHGFDSFEGLPEHWAGHPAGLYSAARQLPEVPQNAQLHVGLFADSLPPFVAAHPHPIRLLNVDCDIYRSTREALALLGPQVAAGTVLVFDEYLCNPDWQQDEHRALLEAARRFGWRYDYIAFSLFTKQAVVAILEVDSTS
jgi:tetratricopeptide (TPR) repeat protein